MSCHGIPKPAYEALTKYKVLAWLCPECKGSLKAPDSPSPTALKAKFNQQAYVVDNHMKWIGLSLKEQEMAIDDQTKLIKASIRDGQNQNASYAEIVNGRCSDVVPKVSLRSIHNPMDDRYSSFFQGYAEHMSGLCEFLE